MNDERKNEIALRDKRHLLSDVAHQPPSDAADYASSLWASGVKVLAFEAFGSYQGDWWAKVQFPNGEIYFVNGSYGSCSGCDSFQAEFDYSDNEQPDYLHRLKEFGRDYLTDCRTFDQALEEASKDLEWDTDAQTMVDWIMAQGAMEKSVADRLSILSP